MRKLVTGATGLIGNAIARELIAAGHEVRVLVRDTARASTVVPEDAEMVCGDITNPATLPAATEGVDWVFHAAGMPEQWQRDDGAFDVVNRQGTANVLDAALAAGVSRVVHTSTMDVFRKRHDGTLREDDVDPNPKPTAYERSKQAAAAEVERVRAKGLDVVQTNPAATYGPGPTKSGMTELFVKVLAGKAPMLPPGGFSVAYVDPVARAHVAAAERGVDGEQYLLADTYATVRELATLILEAAGRERVPPSAPLWVLKGVAGVSAPLARAFGFTPLVAPGQLSFLQWEARVDASKAQRELGYEPVDLAEGVRRTVAHLQATARP